MNNTDITALLGNLEYTVKANATDRLILTVNG